ncbi:preprotein translocase subunit SecE [Conexibacter sp. DBS9H8]|uniref:preprotein translocase subunit SecE n=1 Tax=Conexibacter sp. DBS9H8 TaxID=2937801 RepID=UPI00200D8F81|nr:preprotein translocase subunit SecE [Conexibacter sp. DBS9H8]
MAQRNRRRARNAGAGKASGSGPDKARPDGTGHVPGPLESGDELISEAQLAFGRPSAEETPSPEELVAFEQQEAARDAAPAFGAPAGALATTASATRTDAPARREERVSLPGQLVGFLKGSWRELQRVQWPDRQQVFQATGVVLGFVIVAGAFLGVASFAAQKIVNLILYGHG